MSIKRSKILIALSILVLTAFLLVQLIFQKTNLLPQVPPPIPDQSQISPPFDQKLLQENKDFRQIQPVFTQDRKTVQEIDKNAPLANNGQVNVSHSEESVINKKLDELSSRYFKIILWTDFFLKKNYINNEWKSSCEYTNCQFTSDRSSFKDADGLLFHARDVNKSDLPKLRKSDQRWILLNHESPHHTTFQSIASLNGLINWTATYRLDSDFQLSPSFIPIKTVLSELDVNHQRPGMVSWLVSNCKTPSNREAYVEELRKYISVDIYGACGNLTCLPKMSHECYKTLSEKYYFYLSFENSICPDYVTEKFFSIMDYLIVPVVFGGADYKKIAPQNSFIDALSFGSPKMLAQYLNYLVHKPAEYDSYFDWKKYYVRSSTHYACKICTAFNNSGNSKKTWDKLSQWWFDDAPCHRWTDGKLSRWKSA